MSTNMQEKATQISFTLPASDLGQDITITMTPKKSTGAPTSSQYSQPDDANPIADPPPPFEIPRTPSPSPSPRRPRPSQPPQRFNLYSAGDKHAPPGGFYRDITDVLPKPRSEYAVSDELLERFPPAPPDDAKTGWNSKRWYVVVQGHRPGIYFDFWGNVEPLKLGGYGKRAIDWPDAQRLWNNALKKGKVVWL